MVIDDSSCKISYPIQQQSTESGTSENVSKGFKGQSVLAGEPMPKSLCPSHYSWAHEMSDSQTANRQGTELKTKSMKLCAFSV